MLLRLTEPGEGTEDTRRRAALAELDSGAPTAARTCVRRLADARLLTTSPRRDRPAPNWWRSPTRR